MLQERDVIILTLPNSPCRAILKRALAPRSWRCHFATALGDVSALLKQTDASVVLVVAGEFPRERLASNLAKWRREFSFVEWVGLLEEELLIQKAWAQLAASSFFDVVHIPIQWRRLCFSLAHAWEMATLRSRHATDQSLPDAHESDEGLSGSSESIASVRKVLKKYAKTELPVLITGETGTGKEMAANYLHRHSPRRKKPFQPVNCGALSPQLVLSTLFGHEKGAFTGAHQRHLGEIERADGGTLFLDEVGELSAEAQVSLLRVLQEKRFTRVGGVKEIGANIRVVAATHVPLEEAIATGAFREDLFYRLNVLRVHMPPLRERKGDVLSLAQEILDQFAAQMGGVTAKLTGEAERALLTHDWPGNVRELYNRIQRAMVVAESGVIQASDLELEQGATDHLMTLSEARTRADIQAIEQALAWCDQNVTEAASHLGVSRMTLHRLIRKYKIQPH